MRIALGIVVLTALAAVACTPSAQPLAQSGQHFTQTSLTQAQRRKWDAPVLADLDGDGWTDLVVNEHGWGVKIFWNNEGQFAPAYEMVMGDVHGLTLADMDRDGALELLIARGGGSGSNARKALVYRVSENRQFTRLPALERPLPGMRGRTVKFVSGFQRDYSDLINFAFPSKGKGNENYLFANAQGKTWTPAGTLPHSTHRDGQKTLVTDVNNDGISDLFLYGDGDAKLYLGGPGLAFSAASNRLPARYSQVTGALEFDYDNDGDWDLLLTRALPRPANAFVVNPTNAQCAFHATRSRLEKTFSGEAHLTLENLQFPWPNLRLFLGESAYPYAFSGDKHRGQTLTLDVSDALGFPDKTQAKGMYLGYVGNGRWRLVVNAAATASGAIGGCTETRRSAPMQALTPVLLENTGERFRDVTQSVGLALALDAMSAAVADMDNDGLQDVVFFPRGNLLTGSAPVVVRQGAGGFERVPVTLAEASPGSWGLAGQWGDFNLDGRPDLVWGAERGDWRLLKNRLKTDNHYLLVSVGRLTSPDLVVAAQACGTTQWRRVGADNASYSRGLDPWLHFGMGQCDEAAKITLYWPQHRVTEMGRYPLNQKVVLALPEK